MGLAGLGLIVGGVGEAAADGCATPLAPQAPSHSWTSSQRQDPCPVPLRTHEPSITAWCPSATPRGRSSSCQQRDNCPTVPYQNYFPPVTLDKRCPLHTCQWMEPFVGGLSVAAQTRHSMGGSPRTPVLLHKMRNGRGPKDPRGKGAPAHGMLVRIKSGNRSQ